jgi:hypothetical protein
MRWFGALTVIGGLGLALGWQAKVDTVQAERTVTAYAQAWNEPDAGRRRTLLDRSWAEHGIYTDPSAQVKGRAALSAHIGRFLEENRGARIELASGIDFHHGMVRFAWRIVGPNGSAVAEGMDFGELGADGKLVRIVGFFGPPRPR